MKLPCKPSFRILLIALLLAVLSGACYRFGLLQFIDRPVADFLYQETGWVNPDIIIIGIDDPSLEQLGPYNSWTRKYAADLVSVLSQNPEQAPAVIAFDIGYYGTMDEASDQAFAKACAGFSPVIDVCSINFTEEVLTAADGSAYLDSLHIASVIYPYPELCSVTTQGFSNTLIDSDGCVRSALAYVNYNNSAIYSFSYEIYRAYCEANGRTAVLPTLDRTNRFHFDYSGKTGDYQKLSFADVLNGSINPAVFQDAIVLVGAYASGMQDEYSVPVDKSNPMFGVEIHANIVSALLAGKTTITPAPILPAFLCAAAVFLFTLLLAYSPVLPAALCLAAVFLGTWVTAILANYLGFRLPVVTLPVAATLVFLANLILNYLTERKQRAYIVSVLRKYVAPQVVDEIHKSRIELTLGGEERDIAVLFVDIRGFTPLSETLTPGQVVQLLNRYLTLVNECVFRYHGTLDKFIGDAAMAVFNSPVADADYLEHAAQTAVDIIKGLPELNQELMELTGQSIRVGIGIHCGAAVVGNIGSEFRMDYTAIGDTVNTASRLEGVAAPGQILVSQEFAERLGTKLPLNCLGERTLKGKLLPVTVYELIPEESSI